MKALLISAYDAGSHRAWRNGLEKYLDIELHQIVLPPRAWAWRIGTAPWQIKTTFSDLLAESWDVLITTSVLDLATLRGIVPELREIPTIVYWHENQFAYPRDVDAFILMKEVYTLASASVNIFNSKYNRDSLLDGVERFFEKKPDAVDLSLLRDVIARSEVIPVGIEPLDETRAERERRIVWNHRWEWDKAPEVFFEAVEVLAERGVDFNLSIHGEAFRTSPDVFSEAQAKFGERLRHFGYSTRDEYVQSLSTARVVVSSAIHEFQGVAMLEAIEAGARPVAPARLAYPEYIQDEDLYSPSSNEALTLADAIESALDAPCPTYDLSPYHWPTVISQWKEVLARETR